MAEETPIQPATAPRTMADRLTSISKPTLFLILIAVTSIPLWIPGIKVPNEPEISTKELFAAIASPTPVVLSAGRFNGVPEGSTVLLESDWTNSTRGESAGQFKALIRIFIRRHIKACIFTTADPQAPKVARDTLRALNDEQRTLKLPTYDEWKDWVSLGYFPSAEGTTVAIGADVRNAFSGRKATPAGGTATDVFRSPVLQNIHNVTDFPLMVIITASNTSNIVIERLTGKVPLAMMVTGVMGPETQVYYVSHQLIGLSKGLKGVYDLETMMHDGTTFGGQPVKIPDGPGTTLDQGSLYYPTLHGALALLILAVVIGNIGTAMSRKRGQ